MEGPENRYDELRSDIITYGITRPDYDPERKLMLINFYEERNLQVGKEIIDEALTQSGSSNSNYIANFRDVRFIRPDSGTRGELTRYERRVLAYRALLSQAGFKEPDNIRPVVKGLFNKKLRDALRKAGGEYANAATLIESPSLRWPDVARFCRVLEQFIRSNDKAYSDFNDDYIRTSSSGEWAEEDLEGVFKVLNLY